jgi:hypothetical protein
MAIDTYAKLQSELSDTLNRADLIADVTEFSGGTIEGAIKRAISKAERRVHRRVKTREFETSTAPNTVAGTETIVAPTDLLSIKHFYLNTNPIGPLTKKDLTQLYNDEPSSLNAKPTAYALFGGSIYLRPIPDSAYATKLYYYQSVTPLSDVNTSNAILTKYPDLLLYGSLIELTAHLMDDPRVQVWKGFFDEAVKDITDDNVSSRWSGAPVVSNVIGVRSV